MLGASHLVFVYREPTSLILFPLESMLVVREWPLERCVGAAAGASIVEKGFDLMVPSADRFEPADTTGPSTLIGLVTELSFEFASRYSTSLVCTELRLVSRRGGASGSLFGLPLGDDKGASEGCELANGAAADSVGEVAAVSGRTEAAESVLWWDEKTGGGRWAPLADDAADSNESCELGRDSTMGPAGGSTSALLWAAGRRATRVSTGGKSARARRTAKGSRRVRAGFSVLFGRGTRRTHGGAPKGSTSGNTRAADSRRGVRSGAERRASAAVFRGGSEGCGRGELEKWA
jgi:hypothetical protein